MTSAELRKSAVQRNIPVITEEAAAILVGYLQKYRPDNVLEIGAAIGFSARVILEACGARLTTIELDGARAAEARVNLAGFGDRANVLAGSAGDILPYLEERFDFIFLDGPKSQYINYLPYLVKLLSAGGIIFADNIYFKGMVTGKVPVAAGMKTAVKNLARFIEAARANPALDALCLSEGDGIAVIVKNGKKGGEG